MKKFFISTLIVFLLAVPLAAHAVIPIIYGAIVLSVDIVEGTAAPIVYAALESIGGHAAVATILSLTWHNNITPNTVNATFGSAQPLKVYLQPNKALITPAGWNPATGSSTTVSGTVYAGNQPSPPLMDTTLSHWSVPVFASYTASSSSTGSCSALGQYFHTANPSAWSGAVIQSGFSNNQTCTVVSATGGTNAGPYSLALTCAAGAKISADGLTCLAVKPVDGTNEYFVNDLGYFVHDPLDPDPHGTRLSSL